MSRKIATILSLKDKISSPLTKVSSNVTKVTKEMKKSQNQIEKWRKKFVKSIDNVIKKAGKIALATGALAAGIAIKVGFDGLKELDEASAKVKSIAGKSLDLKNIQKDLLKQSNKTGVGVEELAETQYAAISSGVKAGESMAASVQASKLAKAGFTDSASALKVMTATMNVFGLKGEKAMGMISDKLLVTQNLGVTSVNELSESLGTVTPIAKAAGLGLDDVLASTISLTKNGLNTAEAMTGMKGVISSVVKPSKEASDMAKQLGIDFSVSAIKAKGFPTFLEEIKEKTGGSTDMLGKLFGNVRALGAVLTLTDENGFKDFKSGLESLQDSLGMTDEAFATMTNTVGWKLDGLKNTFKNTMTSIMQSQSGLIGEYLDKITVWLDGNEGKIEGWVESVGQGISNMIGFVKSVVEFIKKHEKAITTIMVFVSALYGALKVVALAKGLIVGLNTVMMILNGTLIISPFTWIALAIAAVVAVGYLLYRNWDLIKAKASELWGVIKDVFSNFLDFMSGIPDKVGQVVESIKIWFTETLPNGIRMGIDKVVEFFELLPEKVAFAIGFVIGYLSTLPERATVYFTEMKDRLVEKTTEMIQSVTTYMSALPERISTFFISAKERAVTIAAELVEGVVSYISALPGRIAAVFTSVVSSVSEGSRSAYNAAVEWFLKIPERITEAISSALGKIKGFIGNIRNALSGGFKVGVSAGVDGSHKTGLPRVPWDNYVANLHEGEAVLTKDEADDYYSGKPSKKPGPKTPTNNNGGSGGVTVNVTIQGNVIGNEQFANEVGSTVYSKVKLALDNI